MAKNPYQGFTAASQLSHDAWQLGHDSRDAEVAALKAQVADLTAKLEQSQRDTLGAISTAADVMKGQDEKIAGLKTQLEQRNETLDTAVNGLITAKRLHAETFEQLAEVEEAGDKLAEALKALPLAVFEKEMQSCDAAEFSDYAADFYDAMTKARPALYAWQQKRGGE